MADIPKPPPIPGGGTSQPGTPSPGPGEMDRATYLAMKEQDAWRWLVSKSPAERKRFLNFIRSKGYYPDSDVSVDGLQDNDVARMRNFLVYAGIVQKDANADIRDVVAFGQDLLSKAPTVSSGTGRQLTPAADLDAVFKDVVRQQLGRGPRQSELERFRAAYKQMEYGGNAPSVSAAAEQVIGEQNPVEQAATSFSNYAQVFEQMLRSS